MPVRTRGLEGVILISLPRTLVSSRHILDILPEAGKRFPETAKLPGVLDSPHEASRLRPVGSIWPHCFLWTLEGLAQEVGQGWTPCLAPIRVGVGTQTLGRPGGSPWCAPHTGGEAEAQSSRRWPGTSSKPCSSAFCSCFPLRDSQSAFLRPFPSDAEKFLRAFHALS